MKRTCDTVDLPPPSLSPSPYCPLWFGLYLRRIVLAILCHPLQQSTGRTKHRPASVLSRGHTLLYPIYADGHNPDDGIVFRRYTCQAWSGQAPHAHDYIPSNYPDAGLSDGKFLFFFFFGLYFDYFQKKNTTPPVNSVGWGTKRKRAIRRPLLVSPRVGSQLPLPPLPPMCELIT